LTRYWVYLGVESLFDNPTTREEVKTFKRLTKKIEGLSNNIRTQFGFYYYSYVTSDLEDAIKRAKEGISLYRTFNYKDGEEYVTVGTQPECPKCGYLGRFEDCYCSDCGTKLEPEDYISFEY